MLYGVLCSRQLSAITVLRRNMTTLFLPSNNVLWIDTIINEMTVQLLSHDTTTSVHDFADQTPAMTLFLVGDVELLAPMRNLRWPGGRSHIPKPGTEP